MTEKTLLEYWFVLYSRKGIILFITFSAMATAWVLSEHLPPVYEAKTIFFVPKEPDTTTFFAPPGGSLVRSPLIPQPSEDPHGPYIGILKSRTIMELVQQEFPQKTLLNKDIDFILNDEFLFEVYARDRDPYVAASIANAYVKYFNQMISEYSLPIQLQIQTTLEAEIETNQKQLATARKALEDFQEQYRITNLDEETKQLIIQKTSFESQLERIQIEYEENQQRISATERELQKELGIFKTSELIVTSPFLEKLKTQLIDIQAKIVSLQVELTDFHPDVLALQKNAEEVKKNIDLEIKRIIESQAKTPDTFYESLRRELTTHFIEKERIEASQKATKKVLEEIEQRILIIPKLKNQLDILTTEVDRYKRLIDSLMLDLAEVKTQIKRPPQVAVIVDEAKPPLTPVFPVLWLNVVVASMAGFVGGIFYCFFVNYLEETREKRIHRLWKAIEESEA